MQKITNKTLIELGFTKYIDYNMYYYRYTLRNRGLDIVLDFFYTLKALTNIANKELDENYEVVLNYDVVKLDNALVFYLYQSNRYTYKKQNLSEIKNIVKKLLEKMSFEELKELMKKEINVVKTKYNDRYFNNKLIKNAEDITEYRKIIKKMCNKLNKDVTIIRIYRDKDLELKLKDNIVNSKELIKYFDARRYSIYLDTENNKIYCVDFDNATNTIIINDVDFVKDVSKKIIIEKAIA